MGNISAKDKSSFHVRRRGVLLLSSQKNEKKKKSFSLGKIVLVKQWFDIHKKLHAQLFSTRKRAFITVSFLLFLVAGGAGSYYAYSLQQEPSVIYTHKVQDMKAQIGKYMALPKDEDPVIATVTDTTQLPHELFFKKAQNGDKILLYKRHKEAVLYRPSTGQVVTYAVLDFHDVTPTPLVAVAGASTSAAFIPVTSPQASSAASSPTQSYHPDGKILVAPQQ